MSVDVRASRSIDSLPLNEAEAIRKANVEQSLIRTARAASLVPAGPFSFNVAGLAPLTSTLVTVTHGLGIAPVFTQTEITNIFFGDYCNVVVSARSATDVTFLVANSHPTTAADLDVRYVLYTQ